MTAKEAARRKKAASHHCRVSALITIVRTALSVFPDSALRTKKQQAQLAKCKRWADTLSSLGESRPFGARYVHEFSTVTKKAGDFVDGFWHPSILDAQAMGELYLAMSWCVDETIRDHGFPFGSKAQWSWLAQTLATFWQTIYDGTGSTEENERHGCRAGRCLETIFFE